MTISYVRAAARQYTKCLVLILIVRCVLGLDSDACHARQVDGVTAVDYPVAPTDQVFVRVLLLA